MGGAPSKTKMDYREARSACVTYIELLRAATFTNREAAKAYLEQNSIPLGGRGTIGALRSVNDEKNPYGMPRRTAYWINYAAKEGLLFGKKWRALLINIDDLVEEEEVLLKRKICSTLVRAPKLDTPDIMARTSAIAKEAAKDIDCLLRIGAIHLGPSNPYYTRRPRTLSQDAAIYWIAHSERMEGAPIASGEATAKDIPTILSSLPPGTEDFVYIAI